MFALRHLAVVAICFLAVSLRAAETTTLVTNGTPRFTTSLSEATTLEIGW